MQPLENSILRTLIYADVFHFPLTEVELHRYLIHYEPVSLQTVQNTLKQSTILQRYLCQADGYIALIDNPSIIDLRKQRESYTRSNWPKAERYGRWLAQIPFVQMVALTGALAVRNPSNPNDDYDYFLITRPGRVWMARLFAVILVRVVRLWGDELCPNYVLAADSLAQQRHDLFMAHEIAQMHLIFGTDLYQQMMSANAWTTRFLPNACTPQTPATLNQHLKNGLEWVFSGKLGDWIEAWEYRRKSERFRPKVDAPIADAVIDSSQAKGHFDDHGQRVMRQYEARLHDYGLNQKERV